MITLTLDPARYDEKGEAAAVLQAWLRRTLQAASKKKIDHDLAEFVYEGRTREAKSSTP